MHKNALQEYCQKNGIPLPSYSVEEKGPDHQKLFRCTVKVDGKVITSDWFNTKKDCESAAASNAINQIIHHFSKDSLSASSILNSEENRITDIATSKCVQELNEFTQIHKLPIPKYNIDYASDSKPHEAKFEGSIKFYYPSSNKIKIKGDRSDFSSHKEIKNYLAMKAMNYIIQLKCQEKKKKLLSDKMDNQTIFLNKFDSNGVPETYTKPRNYQVELYKQCMKENTICCLPTGTGKTLIACMIIKKMMELNPLKKILFLVDRIPLVFQQSEVIKKQTGLSVLPVCGNNYRDHQLEENCDIIVIIAGLFLNLIHSKKLSMKEFSLIVIDEAHHITKEHPFSVIIRDHYIPMNAKEKPRIVGLTASPYGSEDLFSTMIGIKLLFKKSTCTIANPIEFRDEIESYCSNKSVRIIEIQSNGNEIGIMKFIRSSYEILAKSNYQCDLLAKLIDYYQNDESTHYMRKEDNPFFFTDKTEIAQIEDELEVEGEEILFEGFDKICKNSCESEIIKFTEFDDSNSIRVFALKIAKLIEVITNFGSNYKSMNSNFLSHYTKIAIKNLRIDDETKKLLFSKLKIIDDQLFNVDYDKPCKFQKLMEVLKEKRNTKGMKAIVFVNTRESASIIYQRMMDESKKNNTDFIRPVLITGHGTSSNNGMSLSQQNNSIESFRNGNSNAIIATSVIEEGFDIPECNLVIRIDAPSTVTAMVFHFDINSIVIINNIYFCRFKVEEG